MTNDEAIQWCSGKDVRVVFTSGALVQVQAIMQTPRAARFLQVRASLAEAVDAIRAGWDAVVAGAVAPGDRSLVSAQLPGRTNVANPFAPTRVPDFVKSRIEAMFPPPTRPNSDP